MQAHKKHQLESNKLAKRLRRNVGKAIGDFNMIESGDRVLVCVSGGKDSHALADILWDLKRRAPVDFEMTAFNLDQKQPGFPEHVLPDYFKARGIPFDVVEQDNYSVVTDIIPEGKTMPPKLISDDGANIIIRPLAYCRESDLARYAEEREFPIIPCNLCGSQENMERANTKELLASWEKRFPGRIENMMRSLQNVAPSHLLDTNLYDFDAFEVRGDADAAGEGSNETVVQFFDRRPTGTD